MTKQLTAKNSAGYPTPAGVTVDPVIMTVIDNQLAVLLVERDTEPYLGKLNLPGGFLGDSERPEDTAARKLEEKTGLKADSSYIEQLATYGEPDRDPRGWILTVAYLALVPSELLPEDSHGDWYPIQELKESQLAFNHKQIISDAVTRLRGKLWDSNVAMGLLDKKFTMSAARNIYQVITGKQYDPANFARDMQRSGLVKELNEKSSGRGRPATLFSFTSDKLVWKK